MIERDDFHILDSLPIGCCVLNVTGNMVYCNRSLQRFMCMSGVSSNFFACAPEFQPNGMKSAEMAALYIRKAFESGTAGFDWIYLDNEIGVKECTLSLVRHQGKGDPYAVVCVLFLDELEALVNADTDDHGRFRVMLDSSPLCCHYRDSNLKLIGCNLRAVELFGFASKEEYLQKFDTKHPLYQPDGSHSATRAEELRREALASGYLKFEWQHENNYGEPIPCENTMIRIEHRGKSILLVYIRDLRAEKAIKHESEALVRLMLDATPLGCNVRDANLNMLDCNQEALRLFGLTNKEEYCRRFSALSPERQPDGSLSRDKAKQLFAKARENGQIKFEWMHQNVEHELVPCEVTIVSMLRHGELIYTSYIRDLRELRKTMSRLRALEGKVYVDALTSIYNRRYLFEIGVRELQKAESDHTPLSCIVFDIDFFKNVNDTYGHRTGDMVLQHLAQTVTGQLRSSSIFARYGGEEFVILLPDTKLEVAAAVAERVRKAVMQKEIVCDQNSIKVTISLGVAGWEEGMQNLEQLLNAADEALYRAKAGGRNNCQIHQGAK